MRISELGAATGVGIETIRYYERIGLLAPPVRADNGYRHYGDADVERLAFIRHCRALDLGLSEIRRLLEIVDRPGERCRDADRVIDRQIERVRAQADALRELEAKLRALRSRCRAAGRGAYCGILEGLKTRARRDQGAARHGFGECRSSSTRR